MNSIITLNKVSKFFITSKKISILNKINYKFLKGKVYSLTGPSGSGKSTLLNILSLIDRPSTGNLKIENFNINFSDAENNDKIRSKKIGIIYQQNNLLADFTALENVYLARLTLENNMYLTENVNHNGFFKQTPITIDEITVISGTNEVLHTGFFPMSHYLIALCVTKK